MRKIISLCAVFILLLSFSGISYGAPEKKTNGLDLLLEAPKWFADDKDTHQFLRFETPKMVLSSYPYASDLEDILEAAEDYRNKYQLIEPKTNVRLPLSAKDLMAISKNLKGEYLLYARFEPEFSTQKGPWDSLTNPVVLNIIIVDGVNQEVLFEKTYPCIESPDETIDLGTRMGVHYTRPGDPSIRLTPKETVKTGLRHATPEVKAFLDEVMLKKNSQILNEAQ